MSDETKVFEQTVDSLFKGMDAFLSTKTVVGNPIEIADTIIIPLIDVSFGVGAGVFTQEKKNTGGGGLGGKMVPSAVLVIHDGMTRLINISTHSGMDKLLDLVPDFVDGFRAKLGKSSTSNDDARKEAAKAVEEAVLAAGDEISEE